MKCPHCGKEIHAKSEGRPELAAALALVGLFLVFLVWFAVTHS